MRSRHGKIFQGPLATWEATSFHLTLPRLYSTVGSAPGVSVSARWRPGASDSTQLLGCGRLAVPGWTGGGLESTARDSWARPGKPRRGAARVRRAGPAPRANRLAHRGADTPRLGGDELRSRRALRQGRLDAKLAKPRALGGLGRSSARREHGGPACRRYPKTPETSGARRPGKAGSQDRNGRQGPRPAECCRAARRQPASLPRGQPRALA